MDRNLDEKLKLWQYDVLTSYNNSTQLVINRHTKQLMIKKEMPAEEFELHKKLSEIHHKNIIDIFDCILNNNKCIVLEQYIAGQTLEMLCSNSVLGEIFTKKIIIELCDGLEFLHSNKIVHRDLNPSNVMITDDGTIKIIDFDISRFEKQAVPKDTKILGTEGYAAPEQFGFKQSTSKTDIYALGVLTNFLLTKALPSEIMYSGSLTPVIKKCIEFNDNDRYQSVAELRLVLEGKAPPEQSILDKIISGIPGIKSKNKKVKIISVILYIYLFIYMYISYTSFCHNFYQAVYITLIYIIAVFIPIICISNFLDFQSHIFKHTSINAKRTFFRIIGIMFIIIGVFLFPSLIKFR